MHCVFVAGSCCHPATIISPLQGIKCFLLPVSNPNAFLESCDLHDAVTLQGMSASHMEPFPTYYLLTISQDGPCRSSLRQLSRCWDTGSQVKTREGIPRGQKLTDLKWPNQRQQKQIITNCGHL